MDENLHLLLTRPEAGRLLGVSVETVERMISLGAVEPVYLHSKAHPRVRRADIEALVRGGGVKRASGEAAP
jgi:hypothetical protein